MNARQWFLSALATTLTIPIVTFGQNRAEDGGLVPCGDAGEAPCQMCHFVDLANYTTNWLVGILSIAAAIMFLIAGYRLVTAGGNPSVMKSAKDMIVNVTIGFIIVLAAWLFIDFIMKSLLLDGNTAIGPWNGIACVDQPVFRTDAGFVGTMQTQAALICTTVDDCATRAQECLGGVGDVVTINGESRVICPATAGGALPPDLSGVAACDPELVGRYFPEQVGNAQCVIGGESTCGAGLVSTTDTMRNDGGRAFSFGPTQINLTVHPVIGCGERLNCPDAFRGQDYGAVVIDEDLYQRCAAAVQDLDCGLTNSRRIYDDALARHGNGWQPWSAAGIDGCGLHNFY